MLPWSRQCGFKGTLEPDRWCRMNHVSWLCLRMTVEPLQTPWILQDTAQQLIDLIILQGLGA